MVSEFPGNTYVIFKYKVLNIGPKTKVWFVL